MSTAAAAMLDEYLAERGNMLVTGYDITALTLREVPGVVLAALRSAVKPPATDYATLADGLRVAVCPSPSRDASTCCCPTPAA